MRISINLATRPFVELRPLFARLRLTMAALALTAVGLGVGLHVMNGHARVAQAQMDDLKAQTTTLETERQTNERRMMEPQNRAVLERSRFLNDLFAEKSFSWTSVLMDLEAVLPAGVQVTSIEPTVTKEGDINMRLRVSGQREASVDLVRNLERSQRFLAPRLASETAQTQEPGRVAVAVQTGVPGGVQFDILSGYIPLPPVTKETVENGEGVAQASRGKVRPPSTGHKAVGHTGVGAKPAGPAAKASKPSADGGAR
jgi:type IV pilus assembly protein PilN